MLLTKEQIAAQLRAIKPKMIQLKVYTAEEFIADFYDDMTAELRIAVREKVNRIQSYFDEFIVEPN